MKQKEREGIAQCYGQITFDELSLKAFALDGPWKPLNSPGKGKC